MTELHIEPIKDVAGALLPGTWRYFILYDGQTEVGRGGYYVVSSDEAELAGSINEPMRNKGYGRTFLDLIVRDAIEKGGFDQISSPSMTIHPGLERLLLEYGFRIGHETTRWSEARESLLIHRSYRLNLAEYLAANSRSTDLAASAA